MRPYDDLRKTQAEVAEKHRAELLHKPSNVASLKLEAARQETPEAAPKPTDYLPQNPLRNMTTEQVVGFKRATGAWDKEQGQQYLQAQAERSHNDQLVMNQKHTHHAREFVQELRAREMSPPDVAKLYEQHGMKREAEAFKREQQIFANGHDDEGGKQHCVEQARAALKVEASADRRKAQQAERLEAQVNTYQATKTQQQPPPEAMKAPEKPVRTQEPPRVAVATLDGGMAAQQREAMERVARIEARKQNPNSQAKDPDQARQDAERVARIEARKRGEPVTQEKHDMPPPTPKPRISR